MFQEIGIPQGEVIEEVAGEEGVLERIIDDVKEFSFTGYLEVTISNSRELNGLMAFRAGRPVLSVYVYRGDDVERVYTGSRAARFVWEDSVWTGSKIRVHGGVDPEEIESLFPGAEISQSQLSPPSSLPVPPRAWEEYGITEDDEVLSTLSDWADEGYDISKLVDRFEEKGELGRRDISYFRSNIDIMRELRRQVERMDTLGKERELESIKRRMVDPLMVSRVEDELRSLNREEGSLTLAEKQIRDEMDKKKMDEKVDEVYNLVLEYHRERDKEEGEVCEECSSPLDVEGTCPVCEVESGPGRPLNPKFTLDNFIAGPNNRFSKAAAESIAKEPGDSYNPLFIYSKSGLGKTHLLQAIGNRIEERSDMNVVYSPLEVFENDFIEAVGSGLLKEFRRQYQEGDVLLLDDVHFLAGKERTQEEVFILFNEMVSGGKQVVLACDRLPEDIPSLSERLTTRFESGLITDIQPPALETRVAIAKRIVREKGMDLSERVIEYVAKSSRNNVRQLEGRLNRLMAFAYLMDVDITLDMAVEILGEIDEQGAVSLRRLEGGVSYMIQEEKAELSHELFMNKVKEGGRGLAIVREYPRDLKGEENTELLWLTDRSSEVRRTVPPSLERIMLIIDGFLEEGGEKTVLIDDLQYLKSHNGFDAVVSFLRNVIDKISESGDVLIVSVNPDSLKTTEVAILEREMRTLTSKSM